MSSALTVAEAPDPAPFSTTLATSEPVDPCAYQQPESLTERFILVSLIGTTVALISIVENSFLSFILLRRKSHRSSHLLYLGLLAVCDVFMACAYIPLMSANILADMIQSPTILMYWYSYFRPMITISHIAMTASSYLIVAATFERYLLTVRPERTSFLNRNRMRIAIGAITLGVLTKFSHALEFEVTKTAECAGTMNYMMINLSELARVPTYNTLWRFFFRNFFTVYVPFSLLAFMNIRIVCVIHRSRYLFDSLEGTDAKRKTKIREATRTLVMVVFSYLLSNVLNVAVTIWEYVDNEGLLGEFITFYTYSVDIISLLTVFAGTLRLPIYLSCQSQLRREIHFYFNVLWHGRDPSYQQAPHTHQTDFVKLCPDHSGAVLLSRNSMNIGDSHPAFRSLTPSGY